MYKNELVIELAKILNISEELASERFDEANEKDVILTLVCNDSFCVAIEFIDFDKDGIEALYKINEEWATK